MVSIALPSAVGVQALSQAGEPDPPRRELVGDGHDTLGVASETVELPHREHVTISQVV
jgi:hypothetical protein